MLITKFDPFSEIRDLEKRLMNNLGGEVSTSNISGFTPAVNTREGEYAYHIEVDLPGVKKESINVDVENNVLTISGERNTKEEIKKEDYYKLESSYGKFQRSFTLPDNIDIENITASGEDGVLEVIVPKKAKKLEGKKIEVK